MLQLDILNEEYVILQVSISRPEATENHLMH